MVAALDWLSKTYHINHIWISAYNSRANGIVERSHRTIHNSIVKACNGDITQWLNMVPYAFWADQVTTRKATGHSPFYNTHGTEPLLPFDIMEANFQTSNLVLVLNKALTPESNTKCKPRYFRPMIIICHAAGGLYCLAEINGVLSKLRFAAFHLMPYLARSKKNILITKFIDQKDLTELKEEDN